MGKNSTNNLFNDDELQLMAIVAHYGMKYMSLNYSVYRNAWFTRDDVQALVRKLDVSDDELLKSEYKTCDTCQYDVIKKDYNYCPICGMSFYSGYACDKCKRTKSFEGLTADKVISITHLRASARFDGWSVGKEKILCDRCRCIKKD